MKSRHLVLALAVATALAACNRHDDADNATPPPIDTAAQPDVDASATTEAPLAATPAPPADGASLAFLATVDQQEIDAGALAQKKGTRADVKAYAAMLQADHQANLTKAQDLANKSPMAMDDPRVADQVRKGDAAMATLQAADAAAFDAAFLQAMVDGHAGALDVIDTQLLPAAQDETVRAFLAETRTAVSGHLDQAKQLQAGK